MWSRDEGNCWKLAKGKDEEGIKHKNKKFEVENVESNFNEMVWEKDWILYKYGRPARGKLEFEQ